MLDVDFLNERAIQLNSHKKYCIHARLLQLMEKNGTKPAAVDNVANNDGVDEEKGEANKYRYYDTYKINCEWMSQQWENGKRQETSRAPEVESQPYVCIHCDIRMVEKPVLFNVYDINTSWQIVRNDKQCQCALLLYEGSEEGK